MDFKVQQLLMDVEKIQGKRLYAESFKRIFHSMLTLKNLKKI